MKKVLVASLLLNLCLAAVAITMATFGDARSNAKSRVEPQQVRIVHQRVRNSDDTYPPVQDYQYRY